MSYTPGPWRSHHSSDGKRWLITGPSDVDYFVDVTCELDSDDKDGDVAAANARLIAASPEMYEALSRLVDAVRAIKSSEFDRASDWVKLDDVLIECERVMGKAVMK